MRIIIVNEEGLGNSVLKFPVVKALKQMHQGCIVDTISTDRNYEFNQISGYYDNVYFYDKGLEIKEEYDIVVDAVFTSHVLHRCIKNYKRLLRIPGQEIDFFRKHEVQHNLDLIGYKGEFIPTELDLFKFPKEDVVGIHTGCLGTRVWYTRHWIIGKWVELIRQISEKYKVAIHLFGGQSDEYTSKTIYKNLKDSINIKNFAGQLSIKYTAESMRKCRLFISLDSGLMHIASALGINSISLWGPTWEVKSHPWVDKSKYVMIRSDIECGGCYLKDRAQFDVCTDNKCMQQITPQMILDKIEEKRWL